METKLPYDVPSPCGLYGIKLPRTYYPENMNIRFKNAINKILPDNIEIYKPETFMSLKHFDYMKKFAKSFTIYKWSVEAVIHTNDHEQQIGVAYIPWIRYTGTRFEMLTKYKLHISETMLPMHKWLKDLDELQNWLGDEEYAKIITYILMDKGK